jgi:hypothetical protein
VSAIAREVGVAPSTVRWLVAQKILRPMLVENPSRPPSRVFNEADVQTIISHYREVGGIRRGRRKK